MITKLRIKNFKKLGEVDINLSEAVVFVGPNNSGKTSALQAISLWELGLRRWAENRKNSKAKKRVGVSINRKDILSIPVPSSIQLWNDLSVRKQKFENDKRGTENVLIEIEAEGYTQGKNWNLGFEFDYQNSEVILCRILHKNGSDEPMDFPNEVLSERIGYLPPMSGLVAIEDKLEQGSINVRIGEGRTAEVLRNLCWNIYENTVKKRDKNWDELTQKIKLLFGVTLNPPEYDSTTGRITLTYNESGKKEFDISNSGRGFQQILLLFSYVYSNENSILLLDEPDAHLEILRQKEIYNILTETVKNQNSQIILATHSEVILNEAADKDNIIAFLGKPHTVNSNAQLVKSLKTIGFENYLLAEQKRFVLYLEGSTDLSMLKGFARVLKHKILDELNDIFTRSVINSPILAREHFYALKEAVPTLKAVALFDKLDKEVKNENGLNEVMWSFREIENYIPLPECLMRYAEAKSDTLFSQKYVEIMEDVIKDYVPPIALRDKNNEWWKTEKITDNFLDKVMRDFFNRNNQPILLSKGNYYELLEFAKPSEINIEVKEKLDMLYNTIRDTKDLDENYWSKD